MSEVANAASQSLARLFDKNLHFPWSIDDLVEMQEHQLQTTLAPDIDLPGALSPWQTRTFSDALFAEAPDLQLLILIKEFGKTWDKRGDGNIPSELAVVFYYAPIVVARLRLGQSITTLADDALMQAVGSLCQVAWVAPAFRKILEEGRRQHPVSPGGAA